MKKGNIFVTIECAPPSKRLRTFYYKNLEDARPWFNNMIKEYGSDYVTMYIQPKERY